MLLFR